MQLRKGHSVIHLTSTKPTKSWKYWYIYLATTIMIIWVLFLSLKGFCLCQNLLWRIVYSNLFLDYYFVLTWSVHFSIGKNGEGEKTKLTYSITNGNESNKRGFKVIKEVEKGEWCLYWMYNNKYYIH